MSLLMQNQTHNSVSMHHPLWCLLCCYNVIVLYSQEVLNRSARSVVFRNSLTALFFCSVFGKHDPEVVIIPVMGNCSLVCDQKRVYKENINNFKCYKYYLNHIYFMGILSVTWRLRQPN